jgi:LysM repeat protein
MQFREFGNALVVALISIALIFGALSISLVEHLPEATATPTLISLPSIPPVTFEASTATAVVPPQGTPLPPTDTPTATATSTPTTTATAPSYCTVVPAGWGQVIVQPYDTLESIAARYHTSAAALGSANCLSSNMLIAGSVLYVPPVPTNTVVACRAGANGWTNSYIVRWGDTFFSIAGRYGTTAAMMAGVNCRLSDSIYPGEVLWVPIIAATYAPPSTITPLPGYTVMPSATPYPTDPVTETPLPYTSTVVPSPTFVPDTPTPYPTQTASPTAFPTATP